MEYSRFCLIMIVVPACQITRRGWGADGSDLMD
jgi:hypothetical protein